MADIWKLHSIERVPNGNAPLVAGNTTVSELQNVAMPVNATVNRQTSAGDIFAATGSIDFTTVDLSFSSLLADRLFDLIGISGECIETGGPEYNLYVARWACKGPAAGSVHRRYTIKRGVLHLVSASCQHKGDLEVSAILKASFDGVNNPVVVTEGSALPNAAQLGDQTARWTLHEADKSIVNGEQVDGRQSFNLDAGVSTSTRGENSQVFDRHVFIDSVNPEITVQGTDITWFSPENNASGLKLGIGGTAVTHANTRFAFRKRNGAGGFVPDATAEHIVMTANGPAYHSNIVSGSTTDPATSEFRIAGVKTATAAPIVITTAAAA